jgi:hypothetical protein
MQIAQLPQLYFKRFYEFHPENVLKEASNLSFSSTISFLFYDPVLPSPHPATVVQQ